MKRLVSRALPAVVAAFVLASCTEEPTASRVPIASTPTSAILDATRGGQPEFFWLPPTVTTAPTVSGVVDSRAAAELAIEVCELDAASACVGAPIARITNATLPLSSRLKFIPDFQGYGAAWLTGPSSAQVEKSYRVTVLRGTTTLGFIDARVVRRAADLPFVDRTRFTGVVLGQPFTIRFRLERPRALNYVRVNEVESSGGSPGDWAEFYNTSTQPFDLSGYVFKDNDDTHAYTLPAGTVIGAQSILVLDEAQFGFGLGGGDQARLYEPDGVTLVDSYTWTSHAPTTYGRCPDGTGAFQTTTAITKGAANDCRPIVKINEVESSGGTPGDWAELYNAGPTTADLSGFVFKDNDDTHAYVIPSGTTLAPGGYLVLDELVNGTGNFNFGLGSADDARLFAPDGVTLVDSYAWGTHAATTYGRCPTGTGPFTTTGAPTKGSANNCGALALAVKINEVESSRGTPGDWVELYNTGNTAADLSGYVFRDNGTTNYVIPSGTTIPAGGFLVLDEAQFVFGLGASDQANFIAPDGVTVLDTYTWTAHAATTYGRCPDGTGPFITTNSPTKGAANDCGTTTSYLPWPGSQTVADADIGGSFFGGNLSGLVYEGSGSATPGTLWAVRNGPGALYRLVWNGSIWVTDTNDGWANGKLLRYPGGTGDPDAEGVTRVGSSVYVSTERNNQNNGVSKNAILLFDPTGSASELTAIREWDLTADLPANGANLGLEAITYIPDAFLVANGFRDEATNALYNPATYPDHNGGLFLVGVEATGNIYAYALNHSTGGFTRVATISSGFASVMDLSFDPELEQLWAVCDNTCQGRSTILDIDATAGSATLGKFIVTQRFERPTGMPDLNNEGFTMARQGECVGGFKPVFWTDDGQTNGVSIRRGLVSCSAF